MSKVVACGRDNCSRKANNLCPNLLCSVHCREFMSDPSYQECRRHERERDTKKRFATPVSVATAGGGGGGAGSSSSWSNSSVKRPRVEEEPDDPFFLLYPSQLTDPSKQHRRARRTIQCPRCSQHIPDVDSFFALHASQCDRATFFQYVDGTKVFPDSSRVALSSSAAHIHEENDHDDDDDDDDVFHEDDDEDDEEDEEDAERKKSSQLDPVARAVRGARSRMQRGVRMMEEVFGQELLLGTGAAGGKQQKKKSSKKRDANETVESLVQKRERVLSRLLKDVEQLGHAIKGAEDDQVGMDPNFVVVEAPHGLVKVDCPVVDLSKTSFIKLN